MKQEKLANALALHQRGKLTEAAKIYGEVLDKFPDDPDALHLLGLVKYSRGKTLEARVLLQKAVVLAHTRMDILLNLGVVERATGNLKTAELCYTKVLQKKPQNPAALSNLGNLLHQLGRNEEALSVLQKSAKMQPDNLETLTTLATIFSSLGSLDQAIETCRSGLAKNPLHAGLLFNLANSFQKNCKYENALEAFTKCLNAHPDHVDARFNLGNLLISRGELAAAAKQFRTLLTLNPKHQGANNNLATALLGLNLPSEAEAVLDCVLPLFPNDHAILFNHALACLVQGKLRKGWPGYESRWNNPQFNFHRRDTGLPDWQSESLQGKTIYLTNEQGFGDTLQFLRFLGELKRQGAKTAFECPTALAPLLENYPDIDLLCSEKMPPPEAQVHCSLTSLGRLLKIGLEDLQYFLPDLTYPTEYAEKWNRLLPKNEHRRIALVWAGNPKHLNDRNRSLPFSHLQTLFHLPQTEFISLQKGSANAELPKDSTVENVAPLLENFADTAAALKQCDMLVSVDTSVAHLAGCLGVPVCLLLPHVPDWRWMLHRDDSPWYPSIKIFRQQKAGDWVSVTEDLKKFLSSLPHVE